MDNQITRGDLQSLVVEALKKLSGEAQIWQICKYIWDHYENDLRSSGKIFYTWQYDVRWAGQILRNNEIIENTKEVGVWKLSN